MDTISATNILVNGDMSSYLGIPLGTFLSVFTSAIMALIVLWIGYKFHVYHEHKIEFTNLKNTESYFFLLLDVLIDATKRYVEAFSELAEQLRDKSITTFSVKVIAGMNINEVKAIPPDRLFKIFITNKVGDTPQILTYYKDMSKNLTAVKLIMGQWEDLFREFMRNERVHQGEYNKHAELFRQVHDRLVHELKNNPKIRDDFVNSLMEISATWQKMKDRRNLYIASEHLFNPLHDLCTTKSKHPLSTEWLNPVMGCREEFGHIVRNRMVCAEQFEEYCRILYQAQVTLLEVKPKLSALPDIVIKW